MSPSQRIYKSLFPSPAVPTDISISQFLLQHNPDDVSQDKIIFSDLDDPNNFLTFGSLRDKASLGSSGLKAVLGLREGDVVSIFARNSVNFTLLAHSVLWSGACFRYGTPLLENHRNSNTYPALSTHWQHHMNLFTILPLLYQGSSRWIRVCFPSSMRR